MLKLTNVSKKFGKNNVLYNINVEFNNAYGVYGLLGRNGVGKTTMMQMIFNMINKYEGEIDYNGQDIRNNSSALENIVHVGGTVYKNNNLFQDKIKVLFKIYSEMYENFDIEYAYQLLDKFQINAKTKFEKLSTGNKTILHNILGLASRVAITIFDEPTNGLDSVNRQRFFRDLMKDFEENPRMFI